MIRSGIWSLIGKLIIGCLIVYIGIAAMIGTKTIVHLFMVLGYNALFAPGALPVYLPNGFIYLPSEFLPDKEKEIRVFGQGEVIVDANEHLVVMGDVMSIMWHENTIYGFRAGIAGEPYYYICTHGEDCSETQHLREDAFIRLLKEKGLPEYTYRRARTYDQLLWDQSKTDIGKRGG